MLSHSLFRSFYFAWWQVICITTALSSFCDRPLIRWHIVQKLDLSFELYDRSVSNKNKRNIIFLTNFLLKGVILNNQTMLPYHIAIKRFNLLFVTLYWFVLFGIPNDFNVTECPTIVDWFNWFELRSIISMEHEKKNRNSLRII